MMKELQFVKKYLRYEHPSSEETQALEDFIKLQAEIHIQGRPEQDLEELPSKFLSTSFRTWRRKHPGMSKLDDATLWTKFTWLVTEFLFETRAAWSRERKGPVCDAGMIADVESVDGVLLGQLKPDLTPEALETVEGRRTQFMDLFERHSGAVEWTEREGTPVARLLLRVLRDTQRGQRSAEEALELLSVVLEDHELKFKERQKRVGLFLALLDDYENFDYQSYAENGPITQFPACGTSETPMLVPALSPSQVEKLKAQFGLNQGQLASILNFDPTDVPAMKKKRSTAIEDAEQAQRMEAEAEAVLEARRAEMLDRLEAVLMTGLEK